MTVPVTVLNNGPDFRFATSTKRGDRLVIAFIIEGAGALIANTWRAQLRGRANQLKSSLAVTTSQVTVTTLNDSLRVQMEINGAGTRLLKPGVYVADCEDVTNAKTWASGTVEILTDRSF